MPPHGNTETFYWSKSVRNGAIRFTSGIYAIFKRKKNLPMHCCMKRRWFSPRYHSDSSIEDAALQGTGRIPFPCNGRTRFRLPFNFSGTAQKRVRTVSSRRAPSNHGSLWGILQPTILRLRVFRFFTVSFYCFNVSWSRKNLKNYSERSKLSGNIHRFYHDSAEGIKITDA